MKWLGGDRDSSLTISTCVFISKGERGPQGLPGLRGEEGCRGIKGPKVSVTLICGILSPSLSHPLRLKKILTLQHSYSILAPPLSEGFPAVEPEKKNQVQIVSWEGLSLQIVY